MCISWNGGTSGNFDIVDTNDDREPTELSAAVDLLDLWATKFYDLSYALIGLDDPPLFY